jgi:hypothetical protein
MISLQFLFYVMVFFFALVGYLRGWQREVLAMSGLVGCVAALMQFGDAIVRLVTSLTGAAQEAAVNPDALRRQEFWIQAIFITLVAFFSYQVVTRIANQATGGRLGERLRGGLERRIIGGMVGAINGYLLIGSLWGFLEYQITDLGYVRLPPGVPYPFDSTVILRPIADSSAAALAGMLPMGIFSPTIWLILFFISFFIVIIALI